MAIRKEFISVAPQLEQLESIGEVFHENNMDRWPHLKNREDFHRIYALDQKTKHVFEEVYTEGRDCAVYMSSALQAFHSVRECPTLTHYVESFERGWVYQIEKLTVVSSEAKVAAKAMRQAAESCPWAVGQMILLYEEQLKHLEAAQMVLKALKQSPLYKKENSDAMPDAGTPSVNTPSASHVDKRNKGVPNTAEDTDANGGQGTVGDKSRTVMVVHGRDENLRKSMFDFLRSLDLRPVEWSEAVKETGKGSPYVGEVLDAAFGMAQAVVVLFTGDDLASLRKEFHSKSEEPYEVNPTPQARPNVFFEAGMALASHPDNTILVEIGNLRPFSDIRGRHTVRLDNTSEKRQDLAVRLETAGCKANMKSKDWHSAGDFTAQEVNEAHAKTASTARPESKELSEEDKIVLQFLASAGDRGFTAQLVSARLQSSLEKAKYVLQSLRDRKLVDVTWHFSAPPEWRLSQSGRGILVAHDLL